MERLFGSENPAAIPEYLYPYTNLHEILKHDLYFRGSLRDFKTGLFDFVRGCLPPASHSVNAKFDIIPGLRFLWAPNLKNRQECAAAGTKYVSQHATFHSDTLGYELSWSIIQNEIHPDLWAHAGRWGLMLSVLMWIICSIPESYSLYLPKIVWSWTEKHHHNLQALWEIFKPSAFALSVWFEVNSMRIFEHTHILLY